MTTSLEILAEKCDLLGRENEELRERVIQLERAIVGEWSSVPIGGLTATESAVLSVISASADGASKQRIFDAVYALRVDREQPEPKIIDVLVCKLRKKLVAHDIGIETVWGWGYRMAKDDRDKLSALREAVS